MSKAVIIGAGKTGRGFAARLIYESGGEIIFIDKNEKLVNELNDKGSYKIRFFGGEKESVEISGYAAYTWENANIKDAELILVSVGGTNLKAVGEKLKGILSDDRKYYIITCENASSPSKVLSEAIGKDNVYVSESTIFCTTTENGGLDINSEDYPYLQFDAELLDGYVPCFGALKPIKGSGNFLTRKLFTYNAASCIIAYLGYLKGYEDYAAAANDTEIQSELDKNYAETNKAMCLEFGYGEAEQKEFALLSRNKFCNKTIVDTVARNAREPQRKLGRNERVIGPMLLLDKYGLDTSVLEKTAAAMLLYDNTAETEWQKIKAENTPGEILEIIAGLKPGEKLYENILGRLKEIEK